MMPLSDTKNIMKMLNLLGFGEHSVNGIPDIFSVWEEAGLAEPVIEEHFGEEAPDKTIVTLPLVSGASKKATKNRYAQKQEHKDSPKGE